MSPPIADETKYDERPPIPVCFPLRGEWMAPNTPGHKIPSHGTNLFGQRFAYDFVAASDMDRAGSVRTELRFWLGGGIPLADLTSWKKAIYSPISGKVITAKDGWPERQKASGMGVLRALTHSFRISRDELRLDMRKIAGNHLIIEGEKAFAFLAHTTTGSIRVREGEYVEAGQHIANVGHTGNSTLPHLHFHLMDSPDLWTANGLPCCFEFYERLAKEHWQLAENAIPGHNEIIRSLAE